MKVVEIKNLTKKFGEFVANDNITMHANKGEILAIVGENGAGKSTLMNMLYGLLKSTSGQIIVKGEEVDFRSPTDAIAHGIGMVHQHFKLVPSLTVSDNIFLGREKTRKIKGVKTPFIDKKTQVEEIQKLIDSSGYDLKATDRIKDLSVGAQQKVEILKMLHKEADILIFDEPTAVLIPQEIDDLFVSLRQMRDAGKTIIIITHKLQEVLDVSDRVYVIKRGKVVGSVLTKDTSQAELAGMMVGRDVLLDIKKDHICFEEDDDVVYKVCGLTTKNKDGQLVVNDVSFDIRKGEILGIAGVDGNGQTELVGLLTGMICSISGNTYLYDQRITNKWPKELRDAGVGIIPEDRYVHGVNRDMTISENIIAGCLSDKEINRGGIFNRKRITQRREKAIEKYDIRVSDRRGNVSQLSGGNAQKVIIARELEKQPEVLIASQPTRGVDIGAIEFIHNSIIEFAESGKAVLLISSEITEIMSLSDRILVMYEGKIIGEVLGSEATTEKLGLLMGGVSDGN